MTALISQDSYMSSRSGVVASSGSPRTRSVPRSSQPEPRLLVRRVGRGLGCSPVRRGSFRSVVSGGSRALHQCQRAPCGGERSSPLLSHGVQFDGGDLLGQLNSDCVIAQTRGYAFSNSQFKRILRWAETVDLVLAPQFIHGKNNVLADSLP